MTTTQQPEALNLEEFRTKVTRAAREPLLARIEELEAQLSAIGAGGVEPLRKAAKPQADRLVALNSLTRYTVGRRGNGTMHTFAHPNGPFLRYAEVEAAMATQTRNKKGIEQ